jgi:predicted enzyme related to lactoylglutathione lyase
VPALVFGPVPDVKRTKNRVHLDLASESAAAQQAIVERLVARGATHVDVGQRDVPWVVLADPEGNEFCVLEPRDRYRDTGPLAAVVLDAADPPALAEFWVAASGWVVRSRAADGLAVSLHAPHGGPPDLDLVHVPEAKTVKNRVHLDVRPYERDDQLEEVERLVELGASPVDVGQQAVTWVVLADPEGNEFCVLRSADPAGVA